MGGEVLWRTPSAVIVIQFRLKITRKVFIPRKQTFDSTHFSIEFRRNLTCWQKECAGYDFVVSEVDLVHNKTLPHSNRAIPESLTGSGSFRCSPAQSDVRVSARSRNATQCVTFLLLAYLFPELTNHGLSM